MKRIKESSIFTVAFVAIIILFFDAKGFSQKKNEENAKETIDTIQALINQNHAKWVAGETSLSNLSWNEWQNYVGLSFDLVNVPPIADMEDIELPPSLDWRTAGGDYVTEIRSQAKCGSCWAFAMTGALESYVLLSEKKPGLNLDLSEQVMLSCSGIGSCKGGRLNASYLEKTGLPPEEFYPYTATDGACSTAVEGWQDKTYKIGDWGSVSQSLSSLKSALVKYGPLATAMMVYEDFMHYKSGIYSRVTGKKLGGHAVLLIGYNDEEEYFIVKNSWSEKWGEEGFFKIAYSEIKYPVYFGLSAIAYADKNGEGIALDYYRVAEKKSFDADKMWMRAAPAFRTLLNWK
ncbi:MAG: C1 family peptidase [Elusimicrobia bacterium]|nr:C1 family peptidase [Elusimicrobiota bacterium]